MISVLFCASAALEAAVHAKMIDMLYNHKLDGNSSISDLIRESLLTDIPDTSLEGHINLVTNQDAELLTSFNCGIGNPANVAVFNALNAANKRAKFTKNDFMTKMLPDMKQGYYLHQAKRKYHPTIIN